jgi:hypothetical protein
MLTKAPTSYNTAFTHRGVCPSVPEVGGEEAIAGTHPHRLTASRPSTSYLKSVGRRDCNNVI